MEEVKKMVELALEKKPVDFKKAFSSELDNRIKSTIRDHKIDFILGDDSEEGAE